MKKLSIITVTHNDGPLLERALRAIYAQQIPAGWELEHIIVAGNDEADNRTTLNMAKEHGSIVLRKEAAGCYNAINYGIQHATGQIIGLVHGSDYPASVNVFARIIEAFETHTPDFVFGDVVFVRYGHEDSPVRRYSSQGFNIKDIQRGFAPPHPSLFITREAMLKVGLYKENYRNAADFEYFVRLFAGSHNLCWKALRLVTTCMESHGSSSTLRSRLFTNSMEKRRALLENGYQISYLRIMLRYFYHFRNRK